MRRLSVGNTDGLVVPHDDEPRDPLVLEGLSDQAHQAGILLYRDNIVLYHTIMFCTS